MSKEKANPVDPKQISILQINVLKSSIESPTELQKNDEKMAGYTMSLGNEVNYDLDSKMVRIRLFLSFEGVSNDDEKSGLKGDFNIEYHFLVENLDANIKKEGESLKMNKTLIATLMGMAYSTSRGIVLERTANTMFKGLVIPIIDPNEALDL